MGYRKYKAILAAIHAASQIAWEVKKPTDTEITEIFIAKSSFHKNLKHFKNVSRYPEMQKWLENDANSATSENVWGVFKDSYTYADFEEWVLNGGTLDIDGRKKGKGKEKQILKGKEKEKEEGGSSKLRKHKKNKNM